MGGSIMLDVDGRHGGGTVKVYLPRLIMDRLDRDALKSGRSRNQIAREYIEAGMVAPIRRQVHDNQRKDSSVRQ